MRKILIDTDVILDFLFDRKPFSHHAAMILTFCERGLIEGYVTPVIISNTYYLLRKTAGHKKVIEKLKQLISILHILPMDRQVIERALYSEFKDFEDALENYAAVNDGEINAIITRNFKDFKRSEIGVFTPESFVKLLNA